MSKMESQTKTTIGQKTLELMRPFLMKIFQRLNKRCRAHAGGDERPVFYEIDDVYPSLRGLERSYDIIREELESIQTNVSSMPRYHELDHYQDEISGNDDKNWRVFMLNVVGKTPPDAQRLCPRTVALIEQIPYVNQAFFSILDPGKSVPAHDGVYCGYLRYHLGIKIPETNPPKIRLKDQFYTWKEREGVLFDDSWNHEVINNASESRVVLLVDVLRPMPRLISFFNILWTRGIGYLYSTKVLKKLDDFQLPETGDTK
jgi:aspartyl/asparaginyl beta-hydroxylase (cupin superfamily)